MLEEKEIIENNKAEENSITAEDLVKAKEMAQEMIDVKDIKYDILNLSQEEKIKALAIKETLSALDYNSLDDFGADVFKKVDNSSSAILSEVKGKNTNNIDLGLNEMLARVNSIDVNDLNKADKNKTFLGLDLVGRAKRKMFELQTKYSTLDDQLDAMAERMQGSIHTLERNNYDYEQLKSNAYDVFNELNTYIAAGDSKLLELKDEIESDQKAMQLDTSSNKMILATQISDKVTYATRLEKKTMNMKNLQVYLAYVQYPAIKKLQEDNELIISDTKDLIQTGVPVFKTNLTLILGALQQRNALSQNEAVREGINDGITKAVSLIKDNAHETQKQLHKTTIDTKTILNAVNEIATLNDELIANRKKLSEEYENNIKALEEVTEKVQNQLVTYKEA